MTLIGDVAAYLEAESVGKLGVDIHLADMPAEGELLYVESTGESIEAPAGVVALYEYAGGEGWHTKSELAGEEARLQVLVRGETYEAALARSHEIYDLLKHAVLQLSGRPCTVRANHRPADLGSRDENGRTLVSTNYTIKL